MFRFRYSKSIPQSGEIALHDARGLALTGSIGACRREDGRRREKRPHSELGSFGVDFQERFTNRIFKCVEIDPSAGLQVLRGTETLLDLFFVFRDFRGAGRGFNLFDLKAISESKLIALKTSQEEKILEHREIFGVRW